MSQLATAFAVPPTALPELQQHLEGENLEGFWATLHRFAIGEAFPYSGYVVVVAVEYLRERGIELPVSGDPAVRQLVEGCDPLACTGQPGAAAAAAAIACVRASATELAAYWFDFTGDEGEEAGTAMWAALDWLRHALAAVQEPDWCVIVAG